MDLVLKRGENANIASCSSTFKKRLAFLNEKGNEHTQQSGNGALISNLILLTA